MKPKSPFFSPMNSASTLLLVLMSVGVLISRMMIKAGKLIRLSFSTTVPKMADAHSVVNTAVLCDVSASKLIVLENSTDGIWKWDKHV